MTFILCGDFNVNLSKEDEVKFDEGEETKRTREAREKTALLNQLDIDRWVKRGLLWGLTEVLWLGMTRVPSL